METPTKKVLFFSNQGLSSLHLGIELEIMDRLLSQNVKIYYSTCDKVTKSCFFNPTGNPVGCGICQGRNIELHKLIHSENLIHIAFPVVNIDSSINQYDIKKNPIISDWDFDGINIGKGILSSVISLRRDYEVHDEKVFPLIKEELEVSLRSLLGFKQLLSLLQPEEIYIFNGRFSETYPLLSLCQSLKIPFYTMELGATNQKFELFHNSLPHSITSRQKSMWKLWENATKQKYVLAENWFQEKIRGVNKDDKVYTKNQNKNLLPVNFDTTKTNISIFNSSEDEMKTIDEWQNELFNTQNEAIQKIVQKYIDDEKYHFYLRVHPNLENVNNSQVKEILAFSYRNFTIIPANDPIDTYCLMLKSDLIISFGSTIGIEASFHGKTSICLGKSFYTGMDAVYEPKSFEELYALIESSTVLQPKPRMNTLPYAYYIINRGENYMNFNYKDKFNSSFKGIKIKRFYLISIIKSILYFKDYKIYRDKFKILYNRMPKIMDLNKLKI